MGAKLGLEIYLQASTALWNLLEKGEMQLIQTQLASGNSRMVCWLPRDPRVKIGSLISLAKSDERWRVVEQYSAAEGADIHRDWKVGGLSKCRCSSSGRAADS